MVVSLQLPGNLTVNSGATDQRFYLDLIAPFLFHTTAREYIIFGVMGKFFLKIV
jgi:hypothetical protein